MKIDAHKQNLENKHFLSFYTAIITSVSLIEMVCSVIWCRHALQTAPCFPNDLCTRNLYKSLHYGDSQQIVTTIRIYSWENFDLGQQDTWFLYNMWQAVKAIF